jgi:hypothetical protein
MDGGLPSSDAAGFDGWHRDESVSDGTVSESTAPEAPPPDSTPGDRATPDAAPDSIADGATPEAAPEDAPADGPVVCPTDGSVPDDLLCTGLYVDWASKTVATDVMAYAPAYVLWSDGAQKSRWMFLPPGKKIDTNVMDDWVFPDGTKIWKQFTVGGQVVETRLLWKMASGWIDLVYRWSSDGHSARRLDDGEKNVNGTTYEIPATTQCDNCHWGRGDKVLGFDLIGLGTAGASGVRLADLVTRGLLTRAPPATKIAIPEDATGKAAKALGYLHMNCGVSCHNPLGLAGSTGLYMKLLVGQMYPEGGAGRVKELDTYVSSVGVDASDQPNGVQYKRILAGNAAQSLLPLMALARAPNAGAFAPMPPIISHQPDTTGIGVVQAWINAL